MAAYRDSRDYEAMGGGAPAFIVSLKVRINTIILIYHLLLRVHTDKMNTMNIFIILQGCEVAPDINIANSKYGIHLSVPSADGMSDLWLKCDSVNIWFLPLIMYHV